MTENNVSLHVGGVEISGWTTVSVTRSIAMLAHGFEFSMVDVWQEKPVELKPGVSCVVKIDGKKVLEGYIDKVGISLDANQQTYSISGRSKTADLIDCSVDTKPSSWSKITVENLIRALIKPFEIALVSETDLGEKVSSFSVNTGETVFEALQRVCQNRALLFTTNADGDLLITSSKRNRTTDNLVLGVNVYAAQAEYDYANRFSSYKIRGQKSAGGDSWMSSNTQISASATDEGIARYRLKVFTADNEMTNSLAKRRVAWEAQTRAGRAGKITVQLFNWYQSTGSLWAPNYLTAVDISPLRLTPDSPLLIEEVKFTQDEGGTKTELKLVREDAYAPEPPEVVKKKKKSEFDW